MANYEEATNAKDTKNGIKINGCSVDIGYADNQLVVQQDLQLLYMVLDKITIEADRTSIEVCGGQTNVCVTGHFHLVTKSENGESNGSSITDKTIPVTWNGQVDSAGPSTCTVISFDENKIGGNDAVTTDPSPQPSRDKTTTATYTYKGTNLTSANDTTKTSDEVKVTQAENSLGGWYKETSLDRNFIITPSCPGVVSENGGTATATSTVTYEYCEERKDSCDHIVGRKWIKTTITGPSGSASFDEQECDADARSQTISLVYTHVNGASVSTSCTATQEASSVPCYCGQVCGDVGCSGKIHWLCAVKKGDTEYEFDCSTAKITNLTDGMLGSAGGTAKVTVSGYSKKGIWTKSAHCGNETLHVQEVSSLPSLSNVESSQNTVYLIPINTATGQTGGTLYYTDENGNRQSTYSYTYSSYTWNHYTVWPEDQQVGRKTIKVEHWGWKSDTIYVKKANRVRDYGWYDRYYSSGEKQLWLDNGNSESTWDNAYDPWYENYQKYLATKQTYCDGVAIDDDAECSGNTTVKYDESKNPGSFSILGQYWDWYYTYGVNENQYGISSMSVCCVRNISETEDYLVDHLSTKTPYTANTSFTYPANTKTTTVNGSATVSLPGNNSCSISYTVAGAEDKTGTTYEISVDSVTIEACATSATVTVKGRSGVTHTSGDTVWGTYSTLAKDTDYSIEMPTIEKNETTSAKTYTVNVTGKGEYDGKTAEGTITQKAGPCTPPVTPPDPDTGTTGTTSCTCSVTSISVSPTTHTYTSATEERQFTVTINDNDCSGCTGGFKVYNSSGIEVANGTSSFKITNGDGTYTIKANDDTSKTATLTLTKYTPTGSSDCTCSVTSISVSPTTHTFTSCTNKQFTVTINDNDCSGCTGGFKVYEGTTLVTEGTSTFELPNKTASYTIRANDNTAKTATVSTTACTATVSTSWSGITATVSAGKCDTTPTVNVTASGTKTNTNCCTEATSTTLSASDYTIKYGKTSGSYTLNSIEANETTATTKWYYSITASTAYGSKTTSGSFDQAAGPCTEFDSYCLFEITKSGETSYGESITLNYSATNVETYGFVTRSRYYTAETSYEQVSYTMSSNATWVTVDNTNLKWTVVPNDTYEARSATITLTQDGSHGCNKKCYLYINQAAKAHTYEFEFTNHNEFTTGSTSTAIVHKIGGSQSTPTASVKSTQDGNAIGFTASSNVNWITVNENDSTVSWTASSYNEISSREGTITLTQNESNKTITIKVIQEKANECNIVSISCSPKEVTSGGTEFTNNGARTTVTVTGGTTNRWSVISSPDGDNLTSNNSGTTYIGYKFGEYVFQSDECPDKTCKFTILEPEIKGIYIANNQPGEAKIYKSGTLLGTLGKGTDQTFNVTFDNHGTLDIEYDGGQWANSSSAFVYISVQGDNLTQIGSPTENGINIEGDMDGARVVAESSGSCSGGFVTASGYYTVNINIKYANYPCTNCM